jgi:hypothetical protein
MLFEVKGSLSRNSNGTNKYYRLHDNFSVVSITLDGLLVIVQAAGPTVRRFKPGWGRWILKDNKIHSMTSFREEVNPLVPCHKILRHVEEPCGVWKRFFIGKIETTANNICLPRLFLHLCWQTLITPLFITVLHNTGICTVSLKIKSTRHTTHNCLLCILSNKSEDTTFGRTSKFLWRAWTCSRSLWSLCLGCSPMSRSSGMCVCLSETVWWNQKWPKLPHKGHNTDKTWIRCYDPEAKRQSSQWKNLSSPPLKKARQIRLSINNRFVILFWLLEHWSGKCSSRPDG